MPQCPRAGDTTGQVTAMGVDHGGSEVNNFSPEFEVKDGKANCIPPILSYVRSRWPAVSAGVGAELAPCGCGTGSGGGR